MYKTVTSLEHINMDCQLISDLHMLLHTSYSSHVTNPNQYGLVTHMNMQAVACKHYRAEQQTEDPYPAQCKANPCKYKCVSLKR